jgi:proteic killer suppression protein
LIPVAILPAISYYHPWGESTMLVRIADRTLDRLDTELEYTAGYSQAIVKAFRELVQTIRSVDDENDLRRMKSLRFEKLKGKRKGEYSMRLNRQFRLIFQIEDAGEHNRLMITGIEDYH